MRARHGTSVRSRLQWLYSLTYSAIFPQRLRYPAYVSPAPQQYGELLHRLRETVIFFQLPGLAGLALLALLEDRGVFLSLLLLLLATLPIQLFFLLCFLRVKERQCVLRLLPTPSVPSPRARWTWISPLAAVFPAAPASVVPRIVYTTPVKTATFNHPPTYNIAKRRHETLHDPLLLSPLARTLFRLFLSLPFLL